MAAYIPILVPLEISSYIEYRTPFEWKEINKCLIAKIGRDPTSMVVSFLCTPLIVLYDKTIPHCSLMWQHHKNNTSHAK